MTLEQKIPSTNWPKESGEYKVVQLDIEGQPYLRFAETKYSTHATILILLANKLEREYPTIEKDRGEYGKDQIPALESDWYKVYGMGKSKIDVGQKTASFYGNSFDYGIGINPEHLNSIKQHEKDWKIE